ncbi:MAG: SDR family oxidoreductase [Pseudomonadota bacterium]
MADEWTLVTGASDGIGKEIARVCAEKGRDVILAARSEDKLIALAEELRAAHEVEVDVIVADLNTPKGASKLWRAATAKGRKVDFLINNAGLGRNGPFIEETEGDGGWEREQASMQVNMVALTELMKLALPHMRQVNRGRILNIASVAGFVPGPGMAVYHATKAYVLSLSRAVQAELDSPDMTVTAFCPGATESNFFKDANMRSARITSVTPPPSARSVAEEAYAAAIAGKTTAVPGLINKITAWATKLMPSMITTAMAKHLLAKA